eukprot:6521029-Alexandrium_andersonii.AAC.1
MLSKSAFLLARCRFSTAHFRTAACSARTVGPPCTYNMRPKDLGNASRCFLAPSNDFTHVRAISSQARNCPRAPA